MKLLGTAMLCATVGLAWIYANSTAREHLENKCVKLGVDYYKETDSYPVITSPPNTGRKTEVVVREQCEDSNAAFDFVKS